MKLSSKIIAPYKNTPLIDYLVKRFTYLQREQWLERIAEGRFEYEGVLASAETRVKQGGLLVYDVPPFPQPDANFDYQIVYEDEWIVGVNKPDNLRVHGEGRFMMANLSYHIRNEHTPPYPGLYLVNRLDADTSGVVLFAKDKDTAREMGWLFERKEVDKRYLALVHGIPEPQSGQIDAPIGPVKNEKYAKVGRVPRCWINVPKAKPSVTDYCVLETFAKAAPSADNILPLPPDYMSLVELKPLTGRTHQLRVHMASLGCPVVGDRLYILDDEAYVYWREHRDDPRYADLLGRQALHCAATSFVHPQTHATVTIEAPLAADIAVLIDRSVSS